MGTRSANLGSISAILRRFIGSLGYLPDREKTLQMLLQKPDLPANHEWRLVYESSHRTGAGAVHNSDALRRARKAKGVGADRRFQIADRSLSIMSSVSTFASEEDAKSRLPSLTSNFVRKPLTTFSVVHAQTLSDHEISALPEPLVYEESFTGPNGPGTMRFVAGTVDRILLVLWCSATGQMWDWSDVNTLVAKQVDRIKLVLNQ
jgi:hypothetical protein